jgi:hypothetical protein
MKKNMINKVSVHFSMEMENGEMFCVNIASFSTFKKFELNDVIALNAEKTFPFYYQIEEIEVHDNGEITLFVNYFQRRKLMLRVATYNAAIIPIPQVKINYQHLAFSIVALERA